MRYRNKKNNKIATVTKQIDDYVHFVIDGLDAVLDVSTFNSNYEPYIEDFKII